MSYNKFTEVETLVWKFLKEENMCCDPDKWKEGYKAFIKYCKKKIPYSEFEDTLLEFRNYYICIRYTYINDNKDFGKFKLSSNFNPTLFE